MGNRYTFGTDDPVLAQTIFALMNGGASAPVAAAPLPPAPAAAPAPPVPPAPVQAPAPAPVPPAPVTAPPVQAPAPAPVPDTSEAPPGWTIDHVRGAAQSLANNPAKGPKALKALLAEFGATAVGSVPAARWPEFYERATAA